ncbi:MAG: diacylglycerol/lipid kinase family protein [Candidatus Aminicenantia bacterium]
MEKRGFKEKKILIIVNPKAGIRNNLKFARALRKKLTPFFELIEIEMTTQKGDGYRLACQGKKEFDLIVACGGDGTVNEVGSALIGENTTLGIIPTGSGNGLARGLKIPRHSLDKAVQVLFQGRDVNIDVGKINEHYFFNVAGVGLDAQIAKDFNSKYNIRGISPYIFYAIKNYLIHPPVKCTLVMGKNQLDCEVLILAFANFREYGGRAIIAPYAQPDDGQLDVCVLRKPSFLVALYHLSLLFNGGIDKLPYYHSFKTHKLKVISDTRILFHYDGEKGDEVTEINISVLPLAFKVRIPTRS